MRSTLVLTVLAASLSMAGCIDPPEPTPPPPPSPRVTPPPAAFVPPPPPPDPPPAPPPPEAQKTRPYPALDPSAKAAREALDFQILSGKDPRSTREP